MTSEKYANEIRKLINDSSTQELPYYGGAYEEGIDPGSTSHINVLARDGGAVAISSTINN